jgi:hypothetical protein
MNISTLIQMSEACKVGDCTSGFDTPASVNMGDYERLREENLVQIKKHPVLPLTLLNYTSRTQIKKKWCPELIQARGLVVGVDGMIIARPIPKNFNDHELKGSLPSGPFEVYEKLDGSMVIMGFHDKKPFFCTRGSFTSQQCVKAETIYHKKYNKHHVDQSYTYCFEVIYPKNKIVVDYGNEEDLFLLAKIHTATGKEAPISNTNFRCPEKLDSCESFAQLKQMDEANKEGFVVRFIDDGFRMKIKFKTYIALHKRPISRKKVIEIIQNDSIPNIPDEGFDTLTNHMKQLGMEYKEKDYRLAKELDEILKKSSSEREVFSLINMSPHKSVLFKMYKNKDYSQLV